MKIYLDYIFFENLIINIVIIYQTSIFTKSNIKLKYIILSSSVLSVYTTIVYILQNNIVENIIIKIIVIGFAIYLAFNPKSIKEYIKKQVYYYIISFTYVGIIISITLIFNISIKKTIVKILIYVLSAFISYLFNKYLWKMWKTNIKNSSLTYKLKIKGQEIEQVDVNKRALHLTEMNNKENKTKSKVYESNIYEKITNKFDVIITNPPIRAGKKIYMTILKEAHKYLKPNGELWFVVRKNQGAKTIEKELKENYNIKLIEKQRGYYIYKADFALTN